MSGKLNASVHLYDVVGNIADGIEVSVCDPDTGNELPERWTADKAASPKVNALSLQKLLYTHGNDLGDQRMDWVNEILTRLDQGDFSE